MCLYVSTEFTSFSFAVNFSWEIISHLVHTRLSIRKNGSNNAIFSN